MYNNQFKKFKVKYHDIDEEKMCTSPENWNEITSSEACLHSMPIFLCDIFSSGVTK